MCVDEITVSRLHTCPSNVHVENGIYQISDESYLPAGDGKNFMDVFRGHRMGGISPGITDGQCDYERATDSASGAKSTAHSATMKIFHVV